MSSYDYIWSDSEVMRGHLSSRGRRELRRVNCIEKSMTFCLPSRRDEGRISPFKGPFATANSFFPSHLMICKLEVKE